MATNSKRKDAPIYVPPDHTVQQRTDQALSELELCCCAPLSALHSALAGAEEQASEDEEIIRASAGFNSQLRAYLGKFLPYVPALSILLLHVSQVEPVSLASPATVLHKRRRYHPTTGFLDQVIANIRRVVRADDQLVQHAESGIAVILPGVDQQGAAKILERVYHSINLLQAETVIPPLTCETTILLGSGTYPEQGETIEELLYHSSTIAHRLILRPALSTQLWGLPPSTERRAGHKQTSHSKQSSKKQTNIPFLQLPEEVPARLRHLIPYALAREIRCAPVGRDHHCLTVAMANPCSNEALRHLAAVTGMKIFPVSCEEEALNLLLEKKW